MDLEEPTNSDFREVKILKEAVAAAQELASATSDCEDKVRID